MKIIKSVIVLAVIFLALSYPQITQAKAPSALELKDASTSATPSAQTTPPPLVNNSWPTYSSQSPQYSNLVIINLLHSANCLIVGASPIGQPCLDFATRVDMFGNTSYTPYETRQIAGGGLLGGSTKMIGYLYTNQPLNADQYVADVGTRLGFPKDVYAQDVSGGGADVIFGLRKIWQVTRNIAYLGLTVIIITIGFMIMFRRRLNPQTVVSAQTALPSLVIAFVLITFSYFLSALMIDAAFFGVRFVAYVFETATDGAQINNIIGSPVEASAKNIITLIRDTLGGGVFSSVAGPVKDIISKPGQLVVQATTSSLLLRILGGVSGINAVLGVFALVNSLFGVLVGLLATLFVVLAVLVQMIRTLWVLVRAYITILIITILGPLIILISAIPGRAGTLTWWWKNILANALIFPAVFAGIMLAGVILGSADTEFKGSLPMMAFPISLVKAVLGYGIILALPALGETVKKALGVPDVSIFAQTIVGGLTGGTAVARRFTNRALEGRDQEADAYYRKYNEWVVGGRPAGGAPQYKGWYSFFRNRPWKR